MKYGWLLSLAALAIALGGISLYAHRVVAEQSQGLQALQRTSAELRHELEIARQQKDTITHDLRAAQDDLGKLAVQSSAVISPEETAGDVEAAAWTERLKQLRVLFERSPAQRIPEMAELSEDDWLSISRTAHLDDDKGLRLALAAARTAAKLKVGQRLNVALVTYLKGHSGLPPASSSDLVNLVSPPLDPAVYDRYAITKPSEGNQPWWKQWSLEEKTAIDPIYDSRLMVSPLGVAMRTWTTSEKPPLPKTIIP